MIIRNDRRLAARRTGWWSVGLVWMTMAGGLWFAGCVSPPVDHLSEIAHQRERASQEWRLHRPPGQESPDDVRPATPMSLAKAVQTALEHNLEYAARRRETAAAEHGIREARAARLPVVTGELDYTRMSAAPGLQLPAEMESLLGPEAGGGGQQNRYSAGLRAIQPIYQGGAIEGSIRRAEITALMAEQRRQIAIQELIHSTSNDYWNIQLARQMLIVNQDAVASAREHLATVNEKRAQGMATDFDLLRAQVDLSLLEAERISRKNQVETATTQLLRRIGVSQDEWLEPTDELVYTPWTADYEAMVETAYHYRPELILAELAVRLQQQALRIAQSEFRPNLNAWFNYEQARPGAVSGRDQWDDSWRAGVSLTMPLFEGFRRRAQVSREKESLAQRRIELQESESRVRQQVRQSILNLGNAAEFVASQNLNIERAREALKLAEAGYREGVATALEVIEARAALTRAHGLYIEAVHQHTMAELALRRATGQLK